MDDKRPKENVPLRISTDRVEVRDQEQISPSPNQDTDLTAPSSSIETLRSLDISDNLPRLVASMDTEDSPWGGR